ncbi:hypothetical protein, conserved [Trypanosoma brucei gambiense DAL972]|uniref:Uncharacterized protein n=1 Tax=Trypanosoma brucei gambiense (strain MHOM/CI/86/DAL972) TaxID=679716 RepID=C9ZSF7_TRYB9|nr:hypothetical protein, conserved [Trypanosoma brucei gambiense DAL972]CBH12341.1 hypothetical protein, conserved [Trypanosoma brucei gambiense DAL972]|eukprot:XP_011774622.1 hypothetical protein, conserved [Trypanosoma brucei gambiense DAL972]
MGSASQVPGASTSSSEQGSKSVNLLYLLLLLLVIPVVGGILFAIRYFRLHQYVSVARGLKLWTSPSAADEYSHASGAVAGPKSTGVDGQTVGVQVLDMDGEGCTAERGEKEFDPIFDEAEKHHRRWLQRRTVGDDGNSDVVEEDRGVTTEFEELDESDVEMAVRREAENNKDGDIEVVNEEASPEPEAVEDDVKDDVSGKRFRKCDAVAARAWLKTLGTEDLAHDDNGAPQSIDAADEGEGEKSPSSVRSPVARGDVVGKFHARSLSREGRGTSSVIVDSAVEKENFREIISTLAPLKPLPTGIRPKTTQSSGMGDSGLGSDSGKVEANSSNQTNCMKEAKEEVGDHVEAIREGRGEQSDVGTEGSKTEESIGVEVEGDGGNEATGEEMDLR